MACRNIDSRNAAQFTHCKRKFRSRPQGLKYISLYPVGCQTKGGLIGKFRGHATGVKGNSHTLFLSPLLLNIIRQPLRCLTNNVNIHSVYSCSNNSTKASGSKFQIHIKSFFNFIVVISYAFQLSFCLLIKVRIGQPLLIYFSVINHKNPPFFLKFLR